MPKKKQDGTSGNAIVAPKSPLKRDFKAHLRERAEKRRAQLKLTTKASGGLAGRQAVAADSRSPGARMPFPIGGAHSFVVAQNKDVRDHLYLESNHSPPNDSYVGSPYAKRAIGDRPAHAMYFYHHRSPRGRLGGASSTGGSGVNKPWSAEKLSALMMAGKFGEAMYTDFVDILNTTAPNRGFYALTLWRTALYAFKENLLSQAELGQIAALLGSVMSGPEVAEAFGDHEVATS